MNKIPAGQTLFYNIGIGFQLREELDVIFHTNKKVKFCIGEDPKPMVSVQPIKSLGRWYNASLTAKDQVKQIRQDINKYLETSTRPYCQGSSSSGACNLDFYLG